jgi:hypothetical protein
MGKLATTDCSFKPYVNVLAKKKGSDLVQITLHESLVSSHGHHTMTGPIGEVSWSTLFHTEVAVRCYGVHGQVVVLGIS